MRGQELAAAEQKEGPGAGAEAGPGAPLLKIRVSALTLSHKPPLELRSAEPGASQISSAVRGSDKATDL